MMIYLSEMADYEAVWIIEEKSEGSKQKKDREALEVMFSVLEQGDTQHLGELCQDLARDELGNLPVLKNQQRLDRWGLWL